MRPLAAALLIALASPAYAQHAGHHAHHAPSAKPAHTHSASAHGHAPASDALDAQARAQLALVARAVERYRDVRAAERDGWAPSAIGGEDSPLMGEHWSRTDAKELRADAPFDPAAFNTLQYAWVNGRRELVGVSYVIRIAPGEPLPSGFAGDADHWHVHDVEKAFAAMTEERPVLRALGNWWLDANYRDKGDTRSRLAMVHAWVPVRSPDGPFAMDNVALPYLRMGLPVTWATAGDGDAANGINLATSTGCKIALDARLWIANATQRQRRAVHEACKAQAESVKAGIGTGDAAKANAVARKAWRSLETTFAATLDARQMQRIAAITEHDPMSH